MRNVSVVAAGCVVVLAVLFGFSKFNAPLPALAPPATVVHVAPVIVPALPDLITPLPPTRPAKHVAPAKRPAPKAASRLPPGTLIDCYWGTIHIGNITPAQIAALSLKYGVSEREVRNAITCR